MRCEWMGIVLLCGSLPAAAASPSGVQFVAGNGAQVRGAVAGAADDCAGGLVADDGTVEQGLTVVGVTSGVIVDRLTPPSYPFRLTRACVCWFQQNQFGDTTVAFDLAVFDDDGPGGGPGTFLGSVPAVAENVPANAPGAFYGFDLGALDIVIGAGSVFVGPRYDATAEDTFLVCADGSATTPLNFPATSLNGGVSFAPIVAPDFFRALLIRGEGEPLPPATVAVPALDLVGLAALVIVLGAVGLWWLRRR